MKKSAWYWVPTAFFAEGGPYMAVSIVSVILFKSLGMSNEDIGFWTSLIMMPWAVKPLWAPLLDMFYTKRLWILLTQLVMALVFGAIAWWIRDDSLTALTVAAFFLLAFASATHDAAVDGFYLIALDEHDQAFFAGMRGTFYRIASVSVQGGLVAIAGIVEKSSGNLRYGWSLSFILAAAVMAIIFSWHLFFLPHSADDRAVKGNRIFAEFFESFGSFLRKRNAAALLIFLLFFRIAEAQLGKMATVFLKDSRELGGLGLSLEQIGLLYGTIGVIALLIGGIIGGVLVAHYGFGKLAWPLICAINLPDIVYVYLAAYLPESLWITGLCVAIEQFGYGLGYTAFMLVMVAAAEDSGRYKTSHFAIMTGVTILGMNLVGMLSGYVQTKLGYLSFFWYVMACTVPSFLLAWPVISKIKPEFGKR